MAKSKKTAVNAGLAGAATENVRRFGSAVKEHFVGYSGVDNETGTILKKGLKKIAESKVDTQKPYVSIKQQAGFSAEVKEVAKKNAENIINGKIKRYARTDDTGSVNDQLRDITESVDYKAVAGTGYQIKFTGKNAKECADHILQNKHQKYVKNDVGIAVPKDFYPDVMEELTQKSASLHRQIERLNADGNLEEAAVKQKQLDYCNKVRQKLKPAETTNKEAIFARNHPAFSTAKDVAKIANRAGVKQAKMGAALGGGISLVRNFVHVCRGEKSKEDAALAIVGDTTSAAALSYATAFGGAIAKGTAQNASSTFARNISKTNLPAYIATSTIEVGKTLKYYFAGEINGIECLEELGEKGYGMVNSAMLAVIGQIAIPIPVVGALIGSMIGYALSSASYQILLGSLKEADLARTERNRIEKECEQAIELIQECRFELEKNINRYLLEEQYFFNETFDKIKTSLEIGDIDGYILETNNITKVFGKKPLYGSRYEFDQLMDTNVPVII